MSKTVICFDNYHGNKEGWIIENRKMVAWRSSDNLSISLEDEEIENFLKSVISKYKKMQVYLILINNHKLLLINIIKYLLLKKIIEIENCNRIKVKTKYSTRAWWRGEDLYLDYLSAYYNKRNIKIDVDISRKLLEPIRSILNFMCCSVRFLKSIFKIKSSQTFWESQKGDFSEKNYSYTEALWFIPGTAAIKCLGNFMKSDLSRRLNISKISVMENQNKDSEYYKKFQFIKCTIHFSFFSMLFYIINCLLKDFSLIKREKYNKDREYSMDLVYFMYPIWFAKIFEKVDQYRYTFIFYKRYKQTSTEKMILFSTHNEGSESSALYQVNKEKKYPFIFIQHGINYRYFLPMNFSEYYVLTNDDREYLKRVGINPLRLYVNGFTRIHMQKSNEIIQYKSIDLNKKILLIGQSPCEKIFTSSYIYHQIKILEKLSYKFGWKLYIRPHPQNGAEWLKKNFSDLTILDTKISLFETVFKVSPVIAITFFSTSILDLALLGVLTVSIQVDLEEITSRVRFSYKKLSLVIKEKENIEPIIIKLMQDDEYRENQMIRVNKEVKNLLEVDKP